MKLQRYEATCTTGTGDEYQLLSAVYSNHETQTVLPEAVTKAVRKIFACLGTKIVKCKSLNVR